MRAEALLAFWQQRLGWKFRKKRSVVVREFAPPTRPRVFFVGSSIMARMPKASFGVPYVECSIDGLDSFDLLTDRPTVSLHMQRHDMVVCYCGSNDVFNGNNLAATAQKLALFFGRCPCPILYVEIMDSPYLRCFEAPLGVFHECIRRTLARRQDGSRTVRVDGALAREDFTWDGLHLTPGGYGKVVARLAEEIKFDARA